MPVKTLKKILGVSSKVSSYDVAKELFELIKEEEDKLRFKEIGAKIEVDDRALMLVVIHYFSFIFVTKNNDLAFSSSTIRNISNSFSSLLIKDVNTQASLLEEIREKLLKVYNNYSNESKRRQIEEVVKVLCSYLDLNDKIKEDLVNKLVSYIFKDVTLMQDYLISKSRNYKITNQ
ncbi:hypothetical protein JCM16358_20650 [Halanaerocella petrolearia]